jgi:hypothetical protein
MKYIRVTVALFFFCFILGKNVYADGPPPGCDCNEGFETVCDVCEFGPEECCFEIVMDIHDNIAISTLIALGFGLTVYTFYLKEPSSAPF